MKELKFATRLDGVTGSAIRDIFKLIAQPGIISFAGGNPAPSSFEPEIIAEFTQELMRTRGRELLQYGATEGLASLRESSVQYLTRAGVQAQEREILPTTGSTQAIDLLLGALVDPGDVVLAENPTFLGTLQAMQLRQARVLPIDTDEMGAIPDSVEELCKKHAPKAVYIIPNFQNPTGRTLPLARREKLAQLAQRYNFVLMEDDPYRELRYSGEGLPAIQSFDESGRVVYLTSYSKVISPGLRVGAAVVRDEDLRRRMVILKQSSDTHTPLLNQAIVDAYIRSGRLDERIARICAQYGEKLACMLGALKSFPEGTVYTRPEGGLFLWLELPSGIDGVSLLATAAAQGVAFVPGTHFYTQKGTHPNTIRLNFSNATVEQIQSGMAILSKVIRQADQEQ